MTVRFTRFPLFPSTKRWAWSQRNKRTHILQSGVELCISPIWICYVKKCLVIIEREREAFWSSRKALHCYADGWMWECGWFEGLDLLRAMEEWFTLSFSAHTHTHTTLSYGVPKRILCRSILFVRLYVFGWIEKGCGTGSIYVMLCWLKVGSICESVVKGYFA